MSIGTPYSHCPICWDSYDICKCSETDRQKYEQELKGNNMNRFGQLVLPHIDTEDAHDMDPESAAGIGWEACKKEVLRILSETYGREVWCDEVKKEIEKL